MNTICSTAIGRVVKSKGNLSIVIAVGEYGIKTGGRNQASDCQTGGNSVSANP